MKKILIVLCCVLIAGCGSNTSIECQGHSCKTCDYYRVIDHTVYCNNSCDPKSLTCDKPEPIIQIDKFDKYECDLYKDIFIWYDGEWHDIEGKNAEFILSIYDENYVECFGGLYPRDFLDISYPEE